MLVSLTVGRDVDTVILGAGFAGLCAAIRLEQSGRSSFVVLEKADDVGGTWRDNTYPGVECDVPSHLYSFSFAPNPNWSKTYGPGAEIKSYLRHCAERFGVIDRIVFGSAAEVARWDGDRWEVVASTGEVYRGRFLVAGLGGLHTPNVPDFPGREQFAGPVFHTSNWRHDVALEGRRVGMVGTGATAVQAAPRVADIADRFSLFQRSPIWVGPKRDTPYTPEQRERFAADEDAIRAHRWQLWRGWETVGVEAFHAGSPANRAGEEAARRNISDNVRDPELVAKLTPSYNYTCKRPTYSNEYYPMFNRSNVELVTDPIECFTAEGIRVAGRDIDLDVIVLATGFQPFDITTEVDIRGLGDRSLAEAWSERIISYRSIMVNGFPNLFVLLGPNSAGLTSAVQMIEAGTEMALQVMDAVGAESITGLHPRVEEVDAFTDWVDRATAGTTVNQGCTSWWTGDGVNHSLWPESSISYRMTLGDFRRDHLEAVVVEEATR